MNFKRGLLIVVGLLGVLLFTGCQPEVVEVTKEVVVTKEVEVVKEVEVKVTEQVVVEVTPVPEEPLLSDKALLHRGELVLAADFGAPPNQYITEEGVMDGINPDLCGSIAAKLGLKLKWQNLSFPGLIPGLQAGRFDALCTGVFINDERKQIMNMVPYVQWGEGLLVKQGNPEGITCSPTQGDNTSYDACFEQLIGKKVAVAAAGTTQKHLDEYNVKFKEAGKGQIELVIFDSNAEGFQALVNDQVIGLYANDPQAVFFGNQNPGQYELAFAGYTPNRLSLTTLKENRELAEAMKWALEQMKEDGTYQEILDKWGVTSVDSFEIEVTP